MDQLRKQGDDSFYFFAKGILGFGWLVPHIHKKICDKLQDAFQGKIKKRARIKLPRSWLKSTVATIAFPIWCARKNPDIRVLIVQNSHTNAKKKLAAIRGKFESCALFRALYPEMLPTKECIWSSEAISVPRKQAQAEATIETAGTRTKLTSRHYDIIIEDDTVAPDLDDMTSEELFPSKDDIEQAIGFHRQTLPLLADAKTGMIIIVGTRWFERDLLSWSEENEPQYWEISRASRETNGLPDEDGLPAYPERFDDETLNDIRKSMGEYLYSCLYMNKPLSSKGMVFQPEWFRFYETHPRDVICYTTVDLASDPEIAKSGTDYNVVITCAKDLMSGRIYVLDYTCKRCSPSEVIQDIFDHVRRFKPVRVGIESIQYQSALIGWVKDRMRAESMYFMVEPITHGRTKKATRINALEPFVKSSLLLFRNHHRVLISQLQSMTLDRGCLAPNDDVADALSMQLPMWAITRSREEERRANPADDPFSFEHAFEEITTRKPRIGSAYDNVSLN